MKVPEIRILTSTTPDGLDTEVNAYIERKHEEGLEITYSGQIQHTENQFYLQIESFRILPDRSPAE